VGDAVGLRRLPRDRRARDPRRGRARIRVLRARAEHLEREVDRRTEEIRNQAAELRDKNDALELSYRQADRIFAALKQAMPGTVLDDRFLLHEAIGEGGFGVVYRCSEVRTGETFAAKMFKPSRATTRPRRSSDSNARRSRCRGSSTTTRSP